MGKLNEGLARRIRLDPFQAFQAFQATRPSDFYSRPKAR